jgi:hypothetical protein
MNTGESCQGINARNVAATTMASGHILQGIQYLK